MFPKLFAPGKIGSLELPNRVVFAATSSELADKDGFVGDDLVEYYAERARGGTGLIVVEATYIEQEGKRLQHNAMLHDDCFIPGLRKVVQAAGRVIRTEQDAGVLYLLDDRFALPEVRRLLPAWWRIELVTAAHADDRRSTTEGAR